MIRNAFRFSVLGLGGVVLLGLLVFGGSVISYLCTAQRSVKTMVEDSVPVEFQLERARDMVERIVPELKENIRVIAMEEVEIATLKREIAEGEESLVDEESKIAALRAKVDTQLVSLGDNEIRGHMVQRLRSRFRNFKEAEVMLAGKRRLLTTREQHLEASEHLLDKARDQKDELERKIQSLAAKHRLIQASSIGSKVQFDGSQLSQAQQLINQIGRRLDVAERVLARESEFVDGDDIEMDPVDEAELLTEIDAYLSGADGHAVALAEGDEETR